jgi:hypothetical protein
MERYNSVYPANNFLVIQRDRKRARERKRKREREDFRNAELNSELPQPVAREECITAKRKTNSQITQSRTIALLCTFLSHCSFSLTIYLFQFEIPPCQFVSSPARA